jgi:hypothetical protein
MKPESPVVVGLEKHESFKGGPRAGQPQYMELPCLFTQDGGIVSRWEPTEEERKWIAEGCDIFLTIFTDGPYPPTRVEVLTKEVAWGRTPEEKAEGAAKHFRVAPIGDMPELRHLLRNPEHVTPPSSN